MDRIVAEGETWVAYKHGSNLVRVELKEVTKMGCGPGKPKKPPKKG